MIRAGALLAVLVVWGLVTYGNRALEVINPALLPTPSDLGRKVPIESDKAGFV